MNSEQKLKLVIKMMNLAINMEDKQNANSILMDAICLVGSIKDIELSIPNISPVYKLNYERTN